MNDYKTITDYIHNQPPAYELQPIGPIATLRDQFAMAALAGVTVSSFDPGLIAEKAYQVADKMMEKRK